MGLRLFLSFNLNLTSINLLNLIRVVVPVIFDGSPGLKALFCLWMYEAIKKLPEIVAAVYQLPVRVLQTTRVAYLQVKYSTVPSSLTRMQQHS